MEVEVNETTPSSSSNAKNNSLKVKNSKSKKKSGPRDDIDIDALRNMRTLRVTWSKEEDRVLCMAKAVALYIGAPMSMLGLLTMGKVCRDIIRRVLGHQNKTIQACVRRIQFLTRQKRHLPDVPTFLYTLQSDDYLYHHYPDGFVNILRTLYRERTLLIDKINVHFILIMRKLHELLTNEETSFSIMNDKDVEEKEKAEEEKKKNGGKFKLPNTLMEFQQNFQQIQPIKKKDIDDQVFYHNPRKLFDIQVAVIINILHSSMCTIYDKITFSQQTFEIYKKFSEDALQIAFMKARKDGLLVQQKRTKTPLKSTKSTKSSSQRNQSSSTTSTPSSSSTISSSSSSGVVPYSFSSKYRFRLQYLRIPYDVYESCYTFYYHFYGQQQQQSNNTETIMNTFNLKSPNMSQMFFMCESFARNLLMVDINIPTSMLTIDPNQDQHDEISQVDRIIDHYHGILNNAPEYEYTKTLEQQQQEMMISRKVSE